LNRFEDLVTFLREKPVINTSKQCLQRIHLLCTFRHGSPTKVEFTPESVNVRVFLAVYMIAYFPKHVFENMGPLETALFNVSQPLIDSIERIMKQISLYRHFQHVPSALSKDFTALLFNYLRHFKAWKVPDEKKLVTRIKHALLALYQARAHLPHDEPVDSKLNTEFETQIKRLREKLLVIAGQAEVDRLDQERLVEVHLDPTYNDPGPPGGTVLPTRMSNEELAHELLIDLGFRLSEVGGIENPVSRRIRETFHRAFWDRLADDLRLLPPCYVRILRVLEEVRTGLLELAAAESPAIAEALDMVSIKERSDKGLYMWDDTRSLMAAVTKVIKRVQSPARDQETAGRFASIDNTMLECIPYERPVVLCRGMEFLLERVNAMRIDAANSRLRMIGPVIRDHGIDYERGKFADKVRDGRLTLSRTTDWIRRSVESGATSYVDIHIGAFLELVSSPDVLTNATCPETLLFDADRLRSFQLDFGFLAAAASTVARCNNVLGNVDHASTLASLFAEGMTDIGNAVGLAFHDAGFDAETTEKIQRIVLQAEVKTDPVYQLM
jgi:hypothetical protein